MTLTGATPEQVRTAIETHNPFPGTAGFAGEVDGRLVRDVLGRYPLFFERQNPREWSHSPTELTDPVRLPAGHIHRGEGQPERVWSLPAVEPSLTDSEAVTSVRKALDTTLNEVETESLAGAVSGGVVSAVRAAPVDVPCYTVGVPARHDRDAAQSAAERLDVDLRVVSLTHETLERTVPNVVSAIGRTNTMDVVIALPLFVLAERVVADGFESLALGQAADELFGGYAKVAKAPDDHRLAANTVREARRETVDSIPDQFERDVLALRTAGVSPVTPFAHDRVVRAALSLSGDQLVRGETRKWALREAVRPWLPEGVVARKKKALQYGTFASRELDRLARQAGYKRRMDDHVRQYIESLC